MTDFVGWRFGTMAQWYFLGLALFNMAIFGLSEMTTAGSLFADYVGSEAWIIILVLGVLSLAYTAAGGLVVSILTDQLQGGQRRRLLCWGCAGALQWECCSSECAAAHACVAGIASSLLFAVCIVYVAVTFRYPLEQPPPCNEDPYCISGTNEARAAPLRALLPRLRYGW